MNRASSHMSSSDTEEEQNGQALSDLYLIFHLDQSDYGINLKNVTEIVGRQKITRVPNAPEYIKGVINLRGQVIPVIDVRTRFGLPFREYDDRTCAIVINVSELQFGLLVDVVDEVISIAPDRIAPPPYSINTSQSCFVRGMGRAGDGENVKILLAVEHLVQDELLNQIASTVA